LRGPVSDQARDDEQGAAAPGEIIGPMPMVTVTRPTGYAFHVGDPYAFERDGQHFDGVVRDVGIADERLVEITLEMSTGEYRRMIAALDR
jgi:hypothetical protein